MEVNLDTILKKAIVLAPGSFTHTATGPHSHTHDARGDFPSALLLLVLLDPPTPIYFERCFLLSSWLAGCGCTDSASSQQLAKFRELLKLNIFNLLLQFFALALHFFTLRLELRALLHS